MPSFLGRDPAFFPLFHHLFFLCLGRGRQSNGGTLGNYAQRHVIQERFQCGQGYLGRWHRGWLSHSAQGTEFSFPTMPQFFFAIFVEVASESYNLILVSRLVSGSGTEHSLQVLPLE